MGDAKKNVTNAERTFSERMEPVWGQSAAWPAGGRAIPGKRARRPRKPRVSPIPLAGYRIFDLAIFGV